MTSATARRVHPNADLRLTIYAGRTGDRNPRAMAGAAVLGAAVAARLGIPAATIGAPLPPLGGGWAAELEAARPSLALLAEVSAATFAAGATPIIVMGRCASSLATLPAAARNRPDACLVWFDAHADLNTPANTPTGYIGGLVIAAAAGLWESGLGSGLALDAIVLAGARDIDAGEQDLIDAGKVRLVAPGVGFAARLAAAVAGRPVYLHIDCDVLEPGIVPSEYIVPGGLSLDDLNAASAVLARHEIVGLELTEFEASWPDTGAPASPERVLDAIEPVLAALRGAR